MRTVIRGENSEITHQHFVERMFLPVAEHRKVTETKVTAKMVEKAVKNCPRLIAQIANGNLHPDRLKLNILKAAGVIKPHPKYE